MKLKSSMIAIATLISVALLIGIGWLAWWWIQPQTPSERISFLTGVVGILGAAILLYGARNTYRALVNSQKSLDHAQRSFDSAQESQFSERFYKAVELLSSESESVRIGALYALSSLAEQSDSHYQQAIDVAIDFVHRNTQVLDDIHDFPSESEVKKQKRTDVQIAINVLGGRRSNPLTERRHPLDFSDRRLAFYSFRGGWFEDCDFTTADLRRCDFSGACLNGSNFWEATCIHTIFPGAGLRDVRFNLANLEWAVFFNPVMQPRPYDPDDALSNNSEEDWIYSLAKLRFLELVPGQSSLEKANREQGLQMVDTDFAEAKTTFTRFTNTNLAFTKGLEHNQIIEASWEYTTILPSEFEPQREVLEAISDAYLSLKLLELHKRVDLDRHYRAARKLRKRATHTLEASKVRVRSRKNKSLHSPR